MPHLAEHRQAEMNIRVVCWAGNMSGRLTDLSTYVPIRFRSFHRELWSLFVRHVSSRRYQCYSEGPDHQ